MALTGTGVHLIERQPGEFIESEYKVDIEHPTNPRNVTFFIHPSASRDGDSNSLLRDQLNKYSAQVDNNDGKKVLILDGSSYIDPSNLKPHKIRSQKEYWHWLTGSDLMNEGKMELTFVGGNLTRCLGGTIGNLRSINLGNIESIQVNLPLNLIYTINGQTASAQIDSKMKEGQGQKGRYEVLKEIININTNGGRDDNSFNPLQFIRESNVTILWNGEQVDSIPKEVKPLVEIEVADVPDGWIRWDNSPKEEKQYPDIIVNITDKP